MRLSRLYKKFVYDNSIIGAFINPFYISRSRLYKNVLAIASSIKGGRILDVGCGLKPYRNIFQVDQYVGIDVKISGHDHTSSNIDAYFDGLRLPFAAAKFDYVLATEVLEHVFEPSELLAEVSRVLKPDGLVILTIPFCWNEHEQPFDYARYSGFGISYLLEKNGFSDVDIRKSSTFIETIFQLMSAYLFLCLFPKNKYVRVLLTPIIIMPINIAGIIFSLFLPDDKTLPLNLIITAKRNRL